MHEVQTNEHGLSGCLGEFVGDMLIYLLLPLLLHGFEEGQELLTPFNFVLQGINFILNLSLFGHLSVVMVFLHIVLPHRLIHENPQLLEVVLCFG